MKTSMIDTEQGLATDVIEIHTEEVEDAEFVVADISGEDDDQISISCKINGKETSLWIPLERVRQLINGADPRHTPAANSKRSESMKAAWAKRKKNAKSNGHK
jgi:hypothetical protein